MLPGKYKICTPIEPSGALNNNNNNTTINNSVNGSLAVLRNLPYDELTTKKSFLPTQNTRSSPFINQHDR